MLNVSNVSAGCGAALGALLLALHAGCAARVVPAVDAPVGASGCPGVPGPPDVEAFGDPWPTAAEADEQWSFAVAGGGTAQVPVVHYPVRAEGWEALRTFINCNAAEAYTHRRSTLRWSSRGSDGACTVVSARLDWSVLVSLPAWADARAASRADRAAWAEFLAGTARHERGHVLLALDAYPRMEAALTAAGCETIQAEHERLTAELNARQDAYDACTCTGQCQDRCDDPAVLGSAAGEVIGGG